MRNLFICLLAVTTVVLFHSCAKELSTEYGSPATGSLQSLAGDCLPKAVEGLYVAAKPLNDSNYIEVSVNVITPGPYSIYTDSVNGYSFKATGSFSAAGSTKVKLKGSGTPVGPSVDDFIVFFDSSFCSISVTVLPSGSSGGPATFTLGGAPNTCSSTPTGNYYKDTTLDNRHTVKVDVNVTAIGTYSINTTSVNGYFFSKSGIFASTGPTQVTLEGTGKPIAAGTDNFTVNAGSSTCTFSIPVTAITPPAGSCSATPAGTFTAGTATTASNTVTITHTYTVGGTYNVAAAAVNGYSFSRSGYVASAGVNTITLNASGTPLAAGANTFTVNFGDGQTCTFTITVAAAPPVVNNDYFPTTQNSYWTYNDGSSTTDTFKMIVNGTQVFGSNTYQKFVYSGVYTGNEYYRKDAATGFYYQSFDTSGFGQNGITFSQPRYEVLFLKNSLTTNATWNSDVAVSVSGFPATIRSKFTCIDANATITVNGKVFNNVYKITQVFQFDIGLGFDDVDGPYTLYYAKGVGLIYWDDNTTPPAEPIQSIRYWQVN